MTRTYRGGRLHQFVCRGLMLLEIYYVVHIIYVVHLKTENECLPLRMFCT